MEDFQKEIMSPQQIENNPWSVSNAVHFYAKNRQSLEDVYPSELFFLRQIIRPGISILDVGCAAGGFYNIFKSIEPSVRYAGVDYSPCMVREAKMCFPDTDFFSGSGNSLPFKDGSFDMVYCSGAIHLSIDWRYILKECWRVTKNHFLFDVRLIEKGKSIEDVTRSYEKIAFLDTWDKKTVVPYIILNVNDFLHEVTLLEPEPVSKQYFGYFRPVSEMVVTSYREVCMAMCCFSKYKLGEKSVVWKLPL